MSKTACIVQARFGSTRLPGKVLEPLGEAPVLEHVLRRCRRSRASTRWFAPRSMASMAMPSRLWLTISMSRSIAAPECDVLARYHGAAHAVGADVVLRVTSDCPLIDPEVCAAVLKLRSEASADYAANNMPPSWPHGLDCEAFTIDALDEAADHGDGGRRS